MAFVKVSQGQHQINNKRQKDQYLDPNGDVHKPIC